MFHFDSLDLPTRKRLGNRIGGIVRAKRLSPERRRQIASMGGLAKKAKYSPPPPDPKVEI